MHTHETESLVAWLMSCYIRFEAISVALSNAHVLNSTNFHMPCAHCTILVAPFLGPFFTSVLLFEVTQATFANPCSMHAHGYVCTITLDNVNAVGTKTLHK